MRQVTGRKDSYVNPNDNSNAKKQFYTANMHYLSHNIVIPLPKEGAEPVTAAAKNEVSMKPNLVDMANFSNY